MTLNTLLVRKLVGENINPANFRRFGKEIARPSFFHQSRRHFAIKVGSASGVVIERIKKLQTATAPLE
jgi:hypothetical protein